MGKRLLALMLLSLAVLLPAWATPVKADDEVQFFEDGPQLSEAAKDGIYSFRAEAPKGAYERWLQEALDGDFRSMALMAALCVSLEARNEPPCPVPGRFWEKALVDALGEGEGKYLLGGYMIELLKENKKKRIEPYRRLGAEYTLRSARAGHADGMFAASMTGGSNDAKFVLPDRTPLYPEDYTPGFSEEQRYWVSRAIEANSLRAMAFVGGAAKANGKRDLVYFRRAAEKGERQSIAALAVMLLPVEKQPYDCREGLLYLMLAARRAENGLLVENDGKNYPLGANAAYIAEQLIAGDIWVLNKSCMTQKDYEYAVRESEVLYKKGQEFQAQKKREHDELYAAAHARLPATRTAYERELRSRDPLLAGGPQLAKAAEEGLTLFSSGQFEDAYASWLPEALNGDFNSMALLAALCASRDAVNDSRCLVPDTFWEERLVDALGEGEATYLLAGYTDVLMWRDKGGNAEPYRTLANTYALRSARAGHPEGMYAASVLAGNREGAFTPPDKTPLYPKEYTPEFTEEQRYWVSKAIRAESVRAMELVGFTAKMNKKMGVEYYHMAVERGEKSNHYPLMEMLLYDLGGPKDCPAGFMYFALDTRYEENGKFVANDAANYPMGAYVGDLGKKYMDGTASDIDKPCMTQADYDNGVRESEALYKKGQKFQTEKKRKHEKLYAAARAKLPAIKAAYEKALAKAGGKSSTKKDFTEPPESEDSGKPAAPDSGSSPLKEQVSNSQIVLQGR